MAGPLAPKPRDVDARPSACIHSTRLARRVPPIFSQRVSLRLGVPPCMPRNNPPMKHWATLDRPYGTGHWLAGTATAQRTCPLLPPPVGAPWVVLTGVGGGHRTLVANHVGHQGCRSNQHAARGLRGSHDPGGHGATVSQALPQTYRRAVYPTNGTRPGLPQARLSDLSIKVGPRLSSARLGVLTRSCNPGTVCSRRGWEVRCRWCIGRGFGAASGPGLGRRAFAGSGRRSSVDNCSRRRPWGCLYAEGVAYQSPGQAKRRPGFRHHNVFLYPEGVSSRRASCLMKPLWGMKPGCPRATQGALRDPGL
jgi:hypothetical protein